MVRPNEAAGTQWDEIDFENNLWNIPAERVKSKKPILFHWLNKHLIYLMLWNP
jgi:integrase